MKSFEKSQMFLEEASRLIPLASQTFSKSKTQFPYGVSPFFMEKAKGAYTWDIDGNKYVDLINALAAITLGHCDSDVNQAVLEQLNKGVVFSLPSTIEKETAAKICEMIPSAEMVRFGKNGSDATSGAIRLARAYTKKDRIAVCGYHGWQDWYIGSTSRNLGVPKATQELTHVFRYNDIDSLNELLNKYKDQFAAVIMEPMNVEFPQDDFLHKAKDLAHQHGALFILDEMITGFRFANGGAQELFNIEPDLTTLGKGIANGYPLSAVAGKEKYMSLMDEIFFSFTFGGETLSLAAALATMTKMQKEPVVEKINESGTVLLAGIEDLILKHSLTENFTLKGHPAWSFWVVKNPGDYSVWELKSLYMQEMFQRSILGFGSHNISYALSSEDIKAILNAYDEIFVIMKDVIENKSLDKHLKCKPIEPLFKIR